MLLCIPGSLRKEATNRKLAREAARLYGGPSAEAELRLPLYDADLEEAEGIPAEVQRLSDQVAEAEAVVLSTPEYNQSMSGVMKNALDWISRTKGNPWLGKPVALMSAADGRAGGARGAYALRLAMAPFRPRFSCGPEVLVAKSEAQFDAEGRLTEERGLRLLTQAMETLRQEARG